MSFCYLDFGYISCVYETSRDTARNNFTFLQKDIYCAYINAVYFSYVDQPFISAKTQKA